jgi:hypothetical protein
VGAAAQGLGGIDRGPAGFNPHVPACPAVAKIAAIPEYEQEFQTAFGQPPDSLNLVRAIAAYERTLISFDSPFDRFIAGDPNAVDAPTKRGWELWIASCRWCGVSAAAHRDAGSRSNPVRVDCRQHPVDAQACHVYWPRVLSQQHIEVVPPRPVGGHASLTFLHSAAIAIRAQGKAAFSLPA